MDKSKVGKKMDITIMDLQGKILFAKQYNITDAVLQVDIPHLKGGIYIVETKQENDRATGKLIIR